MANDVPVCGHCGAPWRPDVTGACRFCRVTAPPPAAARTGIAPPAPAGARPGTGNGAPQIDGDVLFQLLLSSTAGSPDRPLDGLAEDLRRVAGERCTASGRPVEAVQVELDDWQYQAWTERGEVAARAVHTVRGVVLKRQSLPFPEWLAALAGHLAEFAQTHARVYDAIVALDHP